MPTVKTLAAIGDRPIWNVWRTSSGGSDFRLLFELKDEDECGLYFTSGTALA